MNAPTARGLLERLALVPYVEDAGGGCLYAGPQLPRLLGIPVDEWLAEPRPLARFAHPADRERVLAARRRQAIAGGALSLEYRLVTPRGRVRRVRDESAFAGGEREGFLLPAPPEDELRRSLSLLRATLESTADGILVVDRHGRIGGFNRRFCELFALPAGLASGVDRAASELAPEPLVAPEGLLGVLADLTEEDAGPTTLELPDGRVVERTSLPQELDGEVVGRVWSFRDVTGRLRAEAELRASREELLQAQKSEAVGRLAGGIAHDFNNLLTAIGGYAQLVLDGLEDGDPVREDAGEILAACERAAELTRHLLAFSRRQVLRRRPVDLNALVEGLGRLLGRLLPETIRCETRLAPDLPAVLADPGQLEQALVNLAVNARDAMPGGGVLTIETAGADDEVLLCVRDTGSGMSDEVRARAFEPFFTTKEPGKGTGLGLSTVHGVVVQSGGSIAIESAPGAGTAFHLRLPRADGAAAAGVAAAAPEAADGTGTVLLVEDDPATRAVARRALIRRGYRVLDAGDPETGLALLERDPAAVSALVADVVLPGIDGAALAERARALRPGLPVLLVSGHPESDGRPLETDAPFLAKPFTPDGLVRAVAALVTKP